MELLSDAIFVLQCRTNTPYQTKYILLYVVRIYHTDILYVL